MSLNFYEKHVFVTSNKERVEGTLECCQFEKRSDVFGVSVSFWQTLQEFSYKNIVQTMNKHVFLLQSVWSHNQWLFIGIKATN